MGRAPQGAGNVAGCFRFVHGGATVIPMIATEPVPPRPGELLARGVSRMLRGVARAAAVRLVRISDRGAEMQG